ncbi:MAG: ATP-grasp domain-containing protein, partial [Acidimicrobiales bacterium]|nr:ATP-grasp domain-containing protein [Acidimicrobiales bacterium]
MSTTISRLLVANRGEIAARIIRTCRTLGIETVAVYSDADRDAAFVQLADVSVAIGGEAPADSYLRSDVIVAAATQAGADAVHPGYGFLSENAEFAQSVIDAGLVFVGPRPQTIAAMGSKIEAKRLMADAGVPVLPSAELDGLDDAAVQAAIDGVGYPAMIKASAGGGGRGMRIVSDPSDVLEAVAGARREADAAFGDGTLFAERYVAPSRYVEVQIFGDHDGNVVHFHERECSLQRRHQKVIEEAPSPSLDPTTRTALHEAAVRAGSALGYVNAGTVEFLLAPAVGAGSPEFFFLEVNTRLQVEHPVTEAILGVDLVALQLAVASGGALPDQAAIGAPRGHAIEARLYAEDPAAGFRPSIGELRSFAIGGPAHAAVRVDSGLAGGGVVSRHYDPMVAKVIAHAGSRDGAARQLAGALRQATIDGLVTNRALLVRTLQHPEFLDGRADSAFFERNDPAALGAPLVDGPDVAWYAAAAALAVQAYRRSTDRHTAGVSSGFRTVPTGPQRIALVDPAGHEHRVSYRF